MTLNVEISKGALNVVNRHIVLPCMINTEYQINNDVCTHVFIQPFEMWKSLKWFILSNENHEMPWKSLHVDPGVITDVKKSLTWNKVLEKCSSSWQNNTPAWAISSSDHLQARCASTKKSQQCLSREGRNHSSFAITQEKQSCNITGPKRDYTSPRYEI